MYALVVQTLGFFERYTWEYFPNTEKCFELIQFGLAELNTQSDSQIYVGTGLYRCYICYQQLYTPRKTDHSIQTVRHHAPGWQGKLRSSAPTNGSDFT